MSEQKERNALYKKLVTKSVLAVLLRDMTTGENIVWATDDHAALGIGYSFNMPIMVDWLVDYSGKKVINPRRAEDRADTAYYNAQNNAADRSWFGKRGGRFNVEKQGYWVTDYKKIFFPKKPGTGWKDYVGLKRLERDCGEGAKLTSRHDTQSGKWIPVKNRIGVLDRKLRVISENAATSAKWIRCAKQAVKSIYGFTFRGDDLFSARQSLLLSVIEAYFEKFKKPLNRNTVHILADIISRNLWQMDANTLTVPGTDGVRPLVMNWKTKTPAPYTDKYIE